MEYEKINADGLYIEEGVKIGRNVKFYGNSYILGKTEIGDDCVIYPNNFIKDAHIGDGCVLYPNNFIENSTAESGVKIKSSDINGAFIESVAEVGQFSRLRPNAKVCKNAKVGNFVEIKNATLGEGSKASHLTYVGDADIGKNCNIGCGAIFVNYNGKNKNRSFVGDNSFIGSNCNVIAPVTVGDGAYVCAGTTISESVESGDFVIGRSRQTVKKGRAGKYLKENK